MRWLVRQVVSTVAKLVLRDDGLLAGPLMSCCRGHGVAEQPERYGLR